MYNKEFKLEFLETIKNEKSRAIYEGIFKNTSIIEEKLDKDLMNFNHNEYIEALKLFRNKRSKTFTKSRISSVRTKICAYIDYYIPMYIKFNFLKSMSINEVYEKLSEFSPVETTFLFNKINCEEYKRKIAVYRNSPAIILAAFLAVFNGIKGPNFSELYNLKASDINREEGTIKLYNGRVVDISLELIMALENASKVTHSTQNIALNIYDNKDQVFKFYARNNDNCEYKEIATASFTRIFSVTIKKILSEQRINAKSIYASGLICYMYDSAIKHGFNLKDDLVEGNDNHNILYKRFLIDFGSNMDLHVFKWMYKDFIINNY